MIALQIIGIVVLGYLLGSIPFGLLISRLRANKDVRRYGSGRTGMTNVLRTAGLKAAVMVGILDVGKGALAVFLAGPVMGAGTILMGSYQFGATEVAALAGLAAIAGHIWPVFLKFHGGRGVAVFFGGLLVFNYAVALIAAAIAIFVLWLFRFVSLASIVSMVLVYAVTVIFFIYTNVPFAQVVYALFGGVTIIIVHQDNIYRLVAGKERRLGEKAKLKN